MALILDGGKRQREEVERIRADIQEYAGTLLAEHLSDESAIASLDMAYIILRWQAAERSTTPFDDKEWLVRFHRVTISNLTSQATQARKALDDLVYSLRPPPVYPDLNPDGEPTPMDAFIERALGAKGVTYDQLNEALSVLSDAVEAAEKEGSAAYAEWLSQHGGNRQKDKAALRLELNAAVAGLPGRKTRARIIAAVLAATGVIRPDDEPQEVQRTVQTLRENGR